MLDTSTMLDVIRRNIEEAGFHLYIVMQSSVPRFAYTIGLRDSLGAELVLAGAIHYMADDVKQIVPTIREQLNAGASKSSVLPLGRLGFFTLRTADRSWTQLLLLGALDYYGTRDVDALQIVPDERHWTVDIPDMTRPWSAESAPAWRWLREPWTHRVPETSNVTTNLDALRGARITEVTRWGEDEWEMFAGPGPDVRREDARVVPLGTLLGADPTLAPAMDLVIEEGIWRDDENGDWN